MRLGGRLGAAHARRSRPAPAIVALLIGLLASACGGPTGTPASPAVGSPAPASGAGSSPTPAASPSPSEFTGGTATATVSLASGSLTYAGGSCEHGPGDAWVDVNIGRPNGAEYFGLIAGRSPYSPTDVRTAAGGGTLKGDDVLVTYRHTGTTLVLDHDSYRHETILDDDTRAELLTDLHA